MHALLDQVETLAGTPWLYLALLAIVVFDSVIPVLPAELLMVGCGALAANGAPSLALLIATGSAGAMIGDHIGYALGRRTGPRLISWMAQGRRRASAMSWARNAIDRRGGLILFVARHVPVGRIACTLTMGTVRFPLRRFTPSDALASLFWGAYSSLLGYFGGRAMREVPERGLIGAALILVVVVVVVILVRRHRHDAEERAEPTDGQVGG